MNWEMVSAIIGVISLTLALIVELVKLLGSILDKTKSEKKPSITFLNSGAATIGIGILTTLGLILSASATWFLYDFRSDESRTFFMLLSLLTVFIGVPLWILGMTSSVISIRKGNKSTGCIGVTLNTIGCLPLLIVAFFFFALLVDL